ncbi:BTAD domain-containing putative transcriptional regulator [Sedimentibacter sp. MB31-C6]|uniref:BTAD domain-containing putative transcriptional regulator n=1 Tax=Sedimentibacter sp. MB31-C6 TaxID=3109366 RepID=UPI002DDCC435|nr:BTAD domain-containing putative transcriptional regulator [Sedimentibacter sp. MB36-C1]WSI04928.1 BTAD domain-containing putative transcriptional regulator [Sedimentibacter sp. MB36-C1]
MKIFINTLGGFDIRDNEKTLFNESTRTYRLTKLFQYFITYRNKKLLPETIIDNLWSDSESDNPKNVLRTQIFRLRKIIKALQPKDKEDKYINIKFINGYYCLEIGKSVIIDVDEFENLINQGNYESLINFEKAIELYEEAIKLYKGLYLSENTYEAWIVPARNYYHRLFIKTLYKLIEILNDKKDYEKIILLCEEALVIEPYEEDIHISLMKSLKKIGQTKSALDHYKYTVSLFEREMGTKPSKKVTDFLGKIKNNNSNEENEEIDILNARNNLEDDTKDGAMYCDIEHFKFLYNIQKRKSIRNNENDFLSIITLKGEGKYYEARDLNKWSNIMKDLLMNSLRKGDVFTFWNEKQVLIMLHNIKSDGINKIENRIKNHLNESIIYKPYDISIKFKQILS